MPVENFASLTGHVYPNRAVGQTPLESARSDPRPDRRDRQLRQPVLALDLSPPIPGPFPFFSKFQTGLIPTWRLLRRESERAPPALHPNFAKAGLLKPPPEFVGIDKDHRIEQMGSAENEARAAVGTEEPPAWPKDPIGLTEQGVLGIP